MTLGSKQTADWVECSAWGPKVRRAVAGGRRATSSRSRVRWEAVLPERDRHREPARGGGAARSATGAPAGRDPMARRRDRGGRAGCERTRRSPRATTWRCSTLTASSTWADAVPGAPGSSPARATGMHVAFVTNNAARPPKGGRGAPAPVWSPADPTDVVTSAQAAARLVADPARGTAVFVIGGEGSRRRWERDWSRCSPSTTNRRRCLGLPPRPALAHGHRRRHPGARGLPWVASNTDLTCPRHGSSRATGCGQRGRGVRRREPGVAGKPKRRCSRRPCGGSGAGRPLMVGDRLDTDIEGARQRGLRQPAGDDRGDRGRGAVRRPRDRGRRTSSATLAGIVHPQPVRRVARQWAGWWRAASPRAALTVHGRRDRRRLVARGAAAAGRSSRRHRRCRHFGDVAVPEDCVARRPDGSLTPDAVAGRPRHRREREIEPTRARTPATSRVDEVLRSLHELDDLPVAEHVAVFERRTTALPQALSRRRRPPDDAAVWQPCRASPAGRRAGPPRAGAVADHAAELIAARPGERRRGRRHQARDRR